MATERWTTPQGKTLTLRPIAPADFDIAREALAQLSSQSRYLRFFIRAWKPNEERLRKTVDPDPEQAHGLIVTTQDAGREIAVGAGQIFIVPPGDRAEFALVMADDWQRCGIGSRLLQALVDEARQRGLRELYGEVLAGNAAMLGLARRIGFTVAAHPDDPGVRLATLELAPRSDSAS